jgi:hypothetical protein
MVDLHSKHINIKDVLETVNVEDVISRWTKHIMLAIVSGYMGTGKTDFSLKIAEWMWKHGEIRYIISNIGTTSTNSKYSPFYFEISTLSELILLMYKYKDSKKIFIFDEASIHISHRRAMSSNNISIINLAKLIRKLNTHFVLISQRAGGIDKDLKELATLWMHKESKQKVFVKELFGEEVKTYYIDKVEKTEISFDTNDPADFIFDIHAEDITKIMRIISKNPKYEEFEKSIKEILKDKDKDKSDEMEEEYNNEYIKPDEKSDEKVTYNNMNLCGRKINNEDKILIYLSGKECAKLSDIMGIIKKSKSRTHEIMQGLMRKKLVHIKGKGRNSQWALTDVGKDYIIKNIYSTIEGGVSRGEG